MKPLINAAVLGLVPIPLPANTDLLSDKDDPTVMGDDAHSRDAAESLATEEELARLRRGLGLNVEQPGGRK